jgi:hypothetical protein
MKPPSSQKDAVENAVKRAAKLCALCAFCGIVFLSPDAHAAKKKKPASEPPKVEEQAPAPAPVNENRQFVKTVQEMLAKAGYMSPKEADGKLGARTREAIKRFQKDNGLKEDGRLTPAVFERLGEKARD